MEIPGERRRFTARRLRRDNFKPRKVKTETIVMVDSESNPS